jgi:hypothetical protein
MIDRLFTVINDEPVVNAPLINLGPFTKLWDRDKSDDKSNYKKWLLFIYYMCDYRSSFYEVDDKEQKIKLEVFGRARVATPSTVIKCMEEYNDRNTPAEKRVLDGAISSTYTINKTLNKFQQNSDQLEQLISGYEKQIQEALKEKNVLTAGELMNQKLQTQEKVLDISKKVADLVPKIGKNIETIVELRKKVEQGLGAVEDSKRNLKNFEIDMFLDKDLQGKYVNDAEE